MRRGHPAHPLVGVGVVVWRGDAVLLVRRAKPPRAGQWSLPGGLVEPGEEVRAAARRELLEETGLAVGRLELLEVVDSIERDARGRLTRHYVLIDFMAESEDGEARAMSDAAAVGWFAPASWGELGLWEKTRRVLELARLRRG